MWGKNYRTIKLTTVKLFKSICFTILIICISVVANSQSFYLGKSKAFITQEKGSNYTIQNKNGQLILSYQRVSQKGAIDYDMYYFSNEKCMTIVQSYATWFITFWGDELSEKYKRLDQHHWIEKNSIIHEVSIVNDDKFIYIIKYKD